MTLKELRLYFDTLTLAENAIGIKRENRKHLLRLEKIKVLLLDVMEGLIPVEFALKNTQEELETFLDKHQDIKLVWDRSYTKFFM